MDSSLLFLLAMEVSINECVVKVTVVKACSLLIPAVVFIKFALSSSLGSRVIRLLKNRLWGRAVFTWKPMWVLPWTLLFVCLIYNNPGVKTVLSWDEVMVCMSMLWKALWVNMTFCPHTWCTWLKCIRVTNVVIFCRHFSCLTLSDSNLKTRIKEQCFVRIIKFLVMLIGVFRRQIVTFHRKTYTNALLFKRNSCLVSVYHPLKGIIEKCLNALLNHFQKTSVRLALSTKCLNG